jgi:hypothetical protein|tara:strand:+ start:199 stop:2538 length:2340 start_codon:yes stop_codon:yes gene_type:complete
MKLDDIDIFQEGGEVSPDLGTIEPLSPLEQQRIFNPTLYQRAIDYLTTQGFTPEQERARTFARGLASLIPGVSTDIAKAEKDILGEGLSFLDVVPVAGPVAKQAVKSGADTIKGFHASAKNFDEFRFPKPEDMTGAKQGGGGFGLQNEGVGVYFTTDPQLASAYKTQITEGTRRKGKLYEVDVKISEDEMLKNSVRFDQQKPAVLKKLKDSGILQDVKKAETRRLQEQAKLVEKNKKKYEKFKSDLENKKIPNSSANRDKLEELRTDFSLSEYYLSEEGLDDASLLLPYNYLSPHLKGAEQVRIPGSPRAKAQKLSKAGIKGNFYGITGRDMYDDFGARGILSPDVPKEFVIFDPKRIEITKKYQLGGAVENGEKEVEDKKQKLNYLEMLGNLNLDDIDIFQESGEVSPDLGTIEPLSPLEEQRIFNPTLYQRAIDYLTTQGFTPEQEQARQLARGIASLLPGLSTDIAIAERDRLGQGLSLLDLIPVAGPIAKTATKKGIEGVQAIVETPKKVKSSDKITDLKAQGFNIDEPVYHGTFADFDKFDEKFIGNRDEGFFGRGFYFAKEPGEARYYGPIVKKYFTRGKFLDLSQNKRNSDFELLDKKYFKFWAKELDKIDMLDEPTKKGLKTIKKIDDYVDKNVKFIQSSDNRGNEGIAAYVKHPTRGENTLNRIYSGFGLADKARAVKSLKNQIIEGTRFDSELRKLFPDTENILYSLSDYIRVGGKGAAEFTEKAKKFGYDGIKVGDETLVFDAKNIASADTTVDVAKKNIKFPKGAEE